MAKPVIQGSGPTLKTGNQPSNFWIVATNVSQGDSVLVTQANSTRTWTGTIQAVNGNKCKVQVRVDHTDDEAERKVGPGDLGEISITITNGGGTSATHADEVILDGP